MAFFNHCKLKWVSMQWLAFRNDGKYSAADYAKLTSEKISKTSFASEESWNRFEQEQTIKRRGNFVVKLFHGAMNGLAYMHEHDRLHQSLGPASVVLKYFSGTILLTQIFFSFFF